MKHKNIGGSFDDFLKNEGILEEVEDVAIKRISDMLILYECVSCGKEHYFDIDSLPGGDEHCEYCEGCSGWLQRCN